MKRILQLFCLLLTFSLAARGATYTWTGGAGTGLWNTPANWNPTGVPGAGDTANVSGDVTLPDAMAGTLIWSGGTLRGTTTIPASGVLRAETTATRYWYCNVTNSGLVDFAADMDIQVGSSRLVNTTMGTVRKSGGTGTTVFNPLVENLGLVDCQSGRLRWAGGGRVLGQVAAAAGATVELAFGTFELGAHAKSGDGIFGIVAGSDVTLTGMLAGDLDWTGGTARGGFAVLSNGVLRLTSTATRYWYCNVTNSGLVDFAADMDIQVGSSRLVNTTMGTVRKSGGTGTTVFNPRFENLGLVEGQSGRVRWTGGGLMLGQVAAAAGATVELAFGTFELGAHAKSGDGIFGIVAGSDVTLTGMLAGDLDWTGGTARGGFAVLSNGVLRLTSTATRYWYCNVTNSGLVDFAADMDIQVGSSRLVNTTMGTVRKSGGTGTTVFNPRFENLGLVEGQSGRVRWTGGGLMLGQVAAAAGATVELAFGTFELGAHAKSGDGIFGIVAGSDVTLTGMLAGDLDWTGGTARGGFAVLSNGVLRLTSTATRYWHCNVTNSGLVDFAADMDIQVGSSRLVNTTTGTVRKSGGIGTTVFNPSVENSGVVEGRSGRLSLNGGYRQFGGATRLFNAIIEVPSSLNLAGELSGSGTFIGSVTNHGMVRPGNGAGVLTIQGNYTQAADGTMETELGGVAPGAGYDQLVVTGNASLDGTLRVGLLNGFSPTIGQIFLSVTSSAVAGSFAQLESLAGSDLILIPTYLATAVQLNVIAVPAGRPTILQQPAEQCVSLGESVSLSVFAVSQTPLSYQWQRNGTNVDGATNAALAWPAIQSQQLGDYRVVLHNAAGTMASSMARVAACPKPGTLKWTASLGDVNFTSPTVAPDGTVVTASMWTSKIYAFDPTNGANRWEYQAGGALPGSPAVSDDGTVFIASLDHYLYAIDLTTGQLKWKSAMGNNSASNPGLGRDGNVYVGAHDNKLHAFDAVTGASKWTFLTGGLVVSSPAIASNGTLYVGSYDQRLYALNPTNGTKKWEFVANGIVASSPALGADGTVYFGSEGGRVYALNGATGAKRWEFVTGGAVPCSPALGSDGTVFIGSYDNKFYALHPTTGIKLWEFTTGGAVHSPPAVGANHTVYFGSLDGWFYAVDTATGTRKWSYQTGARVDSGPCIAPDGTVYVNSNDGNLYAFEGGAPLADSPWPQWGGDAQRQRRVRTVTPPPSNFLLRGTPDGINQAALYWATNLNGVTALEVSSQLLAPNWTEVPAFDLQTSLAGSEIRARYIGPWSASLFFRLRWKAD